MAGTIAVGALKIDDIDNYIKAHKINLGSDVNVINVQDFWDWVYDPYLHNNRFILPKDYKIKINHIGEYGLGDYLL